MKSFWQKVRSFWRNVSEVGRRRERLSQEIEEARRERDRKIEEARRERELEIQEVRRREEVALAEKREAERKLEEMAAAFKLDPLSEVTRKERVYLLGMSAIGITIVFTGLIPTEIRTLGIRFGEANRNSILIVFALVVAYFLVAFISYALADLLEWQEKQAAARQAGRSVVGRSDRIVVTRSAIEFLVPVAAGVFAIVALLVRAL